ncbi:hypothetical protein K438DRAFT_1958910 [Mycena galopus ATCC 62051]|nr:hypothetical protein K438DRAFT_1958910 [Mycena galopus ATCC 62051]
MGAQASVLKTAKKVASTGSAPGWRRNFHSLGSRKRVAIAMITYPDPSTHRARVSFDWTRKRRGNGPILTDMECRVDPLHRTSTAVYHGGYDSKCHRRRARTSRCTYASPTGAPHFRICGMRGAAFQTNERVVRTAETKSESDAPLHTATAGTIAVLTHRSLRDLAGPILATALLLDAPDVALPRLFAYRRGRPRAASPPCYCASVSDVASTYVRNSCSRTAALDQATCRCVIVSFPTTFRCALALDHHGGAASSGCESSACHASTLRLYSPGFQL